MDVDANFDGRRFFGVDAVFKGVLNEWDEQQGDDAFFFGPAGDGKVNYATAFEAGLLQLDVVGEVVELLFELDFFAAGVEQDVAHHGGQLDDGIGCAIGFFEGEGIDAVEGIEEKMWVDLGFEVGQFGLELVGFCGFPAVSDLEQEGEEEDDEEEGEVLGEVAEKIGTRVVVWGEVRIEGGVRGWCGDVGV